MKIIENLNKAKWDEFIAGQSVDGGLLQSWEWGNFQHSYGRKVLRLAVGGSDIEAVWQVFMMPLPLGQSYFYIPRPVVGNDENATNFLVEETRKAAKQHKTAFIRIDQAQDLALKEQEFRSSNVNIQPQQELIINIESEKETLLAKMKSKTRYNIRIAEKHGVEIREADQNKYFDDFWRLVQQTYKRQGISPHPKRYYQKMFATLIPAGAGKLYVALHNKEVVAAHFVSFFNNMATYLHGGSDHASRAIMAPYLLHWKVIQQAKDAGNILYNFGGVSETKESWQGISRFKYGFSPDTKARSYAGVIDVPIKKSIYTILKLAGRA